MRNRWLLPLILLLGLVLPFLGKPVHLDDTNFLALARGAAADPWRPHDVLINWQGTTEPAFRVLSNPPGIGWWLAPVWDAHVATQHSLMLPWLALAVWGAFGLGVALAGEGMGAALLICGAPTAIWAAGALTPDLPLLACCLAGMRGIVTAKRRWPWAILLGASALFRYSGVALIPLAGLWAWQRGERRAALGLLAAASLPILALAAHDLSAYGQIHLLAMTGFQSVANTPRDLLRKAAAATAMLGGAGVLPLLCWSRPRRAALGLALGGLLGLIAAMVSTQGGLIALCTVLFCAAGGASLAVARLSTDKTERFLLVWLALGAAFLMTLRFAATRYWLPFLPPVVLLPLRLAPLWLKRAAVFVTLGLAGLLAADDARLASAEAELAREVIAFGAANGGPGLFAGHWGWQHHLEAAGWKALEEDAVVPEGVLLASAADAWSQEPGPGCLVERKRFEVMDSMPGPRVHSAAGAANLHAFLVAGTPPVETYAPWTFANDPLDVAIVREGCAP